MPGSGEDGQAAGPSGEEREFVAWLGRLAARTSSPGFGCASPPGDQGPAIANLARRVIDFSGLVAARRPDLGEPATSPLPGGGATRRVDPDCAFWRAGRGRYLGALEGYFAVLGAAARPSEQDHIT